jgi:hypothetical protein
MTESSCWYHLASLHSLPLDASGSVPSLPLCVASDATLHLVAMWTVVVQCLSFLFVLYDFVWFGLVWGFFFFSFFPTPLFFWEINRQACKQARRKRRLVNLIRVGCVRSAEPSNQEGGETRPQPVSSLCLGIVLLEGKFELSFGRGN